MVNNTPRTPPDAQTRKEVQNGNPVHQPMITRLGRMKMTEASAPAAEQTVWTMLFSRMLEPEKRPRKAIEITAAGIEVAMVRPTFKPRYILAAVKRKVSDMPSAMPRQVSSLPDASPLFIPQTLPASSRQFNKAFLPVVGGEAQALIKRQGPGMVQGAGIDGQPLDGRK